MFSRIALLLSFGLAGTVPAVAQEIKPRPELNARLAPPEKVTATLDRTTGKIRVVWAAVDGAESYRVNRSAPPGGIQPVVLPTPSDTEYVDSNVKPGSTYYYEVAAVNSAGLVGLKRAAPPVEAIDPAAFLTLAPPTNVKAAVDPQTGWVQLSWTPPDRADRYTISFVKNGVAGYRLAQSFDRPFASHSLQGIPAGTRVSYEVKALDRFGNSSESALSNEITFAGPPSADTSSSSVAEADSGAAQPDDSTGGQGTATQETRTRVRAPVVAPDGRVKVGGTLSLAKSPTFTGLQLRRPRWVSLDESKATVNAKGQVRGQAPGFTYIIANGTTADGTVASMVQRVDVTRR